MALISIIEDFHPLNNARLLDRAAELVQPLHHHVKEPVGGFKLKERYSPEKEEVVLQKVPHLAMGKGENLCLDFGTHLVGYLTLNLSYTGSHPDAPAFLKLKFAEQISELSENTEDYDGWVSRSWIQEEYIHVDVLPAQVKLPRRYAFRYLKITMMDTSPKYKLVVKHAECLTETSADVKKLAPAQVSYAKSDVQSEGLCGNAGTGTGTPGNSVYAVSHTGDERVDQIDEVSLRTLANCMQDVFEDGPKRDRRLWMGDLRLQALTNYESFRNLQLVRRCLYLFGGSRFPDGRVSACIFTEPTVQADDTYLFDYSLFYTVALEEYLSETNDEETLNELYDVAMQQIEISLRKCERTSAGLVITEEAAKDAFIDWTENLDKRAAAQAVLIFALRYGRRLARRKNDWSQANYLMEQLELLKRGALETFWDAERELFVSEGQVSPASQIWMVLADVPEPEQANKLMKKVRASLNGQDQSISAGDYPMLTPYMHHYYVAAMLRAGMKDEAREHVLAYWGSMVDYGADTFFEAWDPAHPEASPYGGAAINSYCHAWSCTPAYFIRKGLI